MAGLRYYVSVSPSAEPARDRRLAARARLRAELGLDAVRARPRSAAGRDLARPSARSGPSAATSSRRSCGTSYGLPEALEPIFAALPGQPGWHCWLALADDEPAGAAALFVADGAGYLGLAGTAPEHRGRGAQSALLAARIERARELGCDAVFTETGEQLPDRPSSSYRNIVRAGFEELYVVPNWLSPAP